MAGTRNLVELFGHSPEDISSKTRKLWNLGACPFTFQPCIKHNHDQTIVYGTCSVTSPFGDVVICPNRLYANNYESIKKVAKDAFGEIQYFFYDEFIKSNSDNIECAVALGANSGKEVKIGRSLSMDWVLARIKNNKLIEYVGIEVQSIDITGNYRDAWHAYKNYSSNSNSIPSSEHGLNWANVHKRLIPQIIRKGVVYSKSKYCKKGLYFVLPDIVYRKFEDVVGNDLQNISTPNSETLTVFTYKLTEKKVNGIRNLALDRTIRFSLDEFANRFISGPNLPPATELDNTIKSILGVS